jgi:hypothetical protein
MHIDPVPYGCPPCIHYLHNHNTISCRSRPCCEEDNVIMDDWKRTSPVQFELWNKHQQTSIKNSPDPYSSKKCPTCSSKYIRN